MIQEIHTVSKCGNCPFSVKDETKGAAVCTHNGKRLLITTTSIFYKPPTWCPLRKEAYHEITIVNGEKVSDKLIKLFG